MPSGILIPKTGELTLTLGQSAKTSDFVADALEAWWQETSPRFPRVKELVINADNGPETNSQRTQFMQGLVEFADRTGLHLHLVYYPPYHSTPRAIPNFSCNAEIHPSISSNWTTFPRLGKALFSIS